MQLGFIELFAGQVERGEKRQSLRDPRADGRDPKPGDTLHLYAGQYAPGKRRKLGESICTSTDLCLIFGAGVVIAPPTLTGITRAGDLFTTVGALPWLHACEPPLVQYLENKAGVPIDFGLVALIPKHADDAHHFARADGFTDFPEMCQWIEHNGGGIPFRGLCVRWGELTFAADEPAG